MHAFFALHFVLAINFVILGIVGLELPWQLHQGNNQPVVSACSPAPHRCISGHFLLV